MVYDPYCVWGQKPQNVQTEPVGFILTGKLDFHGFYNGTGSWGIGKGVTVVPHSTIFYKHLADLEGKQVRIHIEVVK